MREHRKTRLSTKAQHEKSPYLQGENDPIKYLPMVSRPGFDAHILTNLCSCTVNFN